MLLLPLVDEGQLDRHPCLEGDRFWLELIFSHDDRDLLDFLRRRSHRSGEPRNEDAGYAEHDY